MKATDDSDRIEKSDLKRAAVRIVDCTALRACALPADASLVAPPYLILQEEIIGLGIGLFILKLFVAIGRFRTLRAITPRRYSFTESMACHRHRFALPRRARVFPPSGSVRLTQRFSLPKAFDFRLYRAFLRIKPIKWENGGDTCRADGYIPRQTRR